MAETAAGSGGRASVPAFLFWLVTSAFGIVAVVFAAPGWIAKLDPQDADGWMDVVVRVIKVLLLSDIYYEEQMVTPDDTLLQRARFCGMVFSVLVTGRLLVFALGDRLVEVWLRFFRRGHTV